MTTLVVGASGATGKLLVEQLLTMGQHVGVIVRSSARIPESWKRNDNVSILTANISEMKSADLSNRMKDCDAVASCLGHNLSMKGLYGKPRRLVADAVRLLCDAIVMASPGKPIRFVLMNTAGNRNGDILEPISTGQNIVLGVIRLLLPPHTDNEKASDHLRIGIGQNNPFVEWVVVRPDDLIDRETVTEYRLHDSPTRSAIFDPGKTSRIQVAHFMARLITDDGLWNSWKGQMPVIYNASG